MENWGVDNLHLHGQLEWVNALTTYTGAYIGGNYGDLVMKNRATDVDVDVRIGKGFETFRDAMPTPHVGLGWRYWRASRAARAATARTITMPMPVPMPVPVPVPARCCNIRRPRIE